MTAARTLFISDLHLHESRPSVSEKFLSFLKQEALDADALYILGDFFEVWAGDDDPNPHHQKIIAALAEFSASGIPLYFMRGNRDFLIEQGFAKATRCILLKDPSVIELYGERILLMHGDSLCSDDRSHQRFRKFSQHPIIRSLFLLLPFSWRYKIAGGIRKNSQKVGAEREKQTQTQKTINTYSRFDVTQTAVATALRWSKANILIHGHTHKPGIHEFTLDAVPKKRIVLGEWGVLGSVLVYSKDGFELIAL